VSHAIQAAIQPRVELQAVIENWNEISTALRESARERKQQVEYHFLS
jgi:hypothetical protein